jgi:hypothetical protein
VAEAEPDGEDEQQGNDAAAGSSKAHPLSISEGTSRKGNWRCDVLNRGCSSHILGSQGREAVERLSSKIRAGGCGRRIRGAAGDDEKARLQGSGAGVVNNMREILGKTEAICKERRRHSGYRCSGGSSGGSSRRIQAGGRRRGEDHGCWRGRDDGRLEAGTGCRADDDWNRNGRDDDWNRNSLGWTGRGDDGGRLVGTDGGGGWGTRLGARRHGDDRAKAGRGEDC